MSDIGTGVESLKREKIHPSCLECRNYYAKGHGCVIDSNRIYYEWQTLISRGVKIQLQVTRLKIDPKTGERYPHQFKPLSPNCLGLNIKELKARNYLWINSNPPCWIDKEEGNLNG